MCSPLAANLWDICAAGRKAEAPVILCSVGVNEKDCPPFASMHRTGLSDASHRQWSEFYEQGQGLQEEGRWHRRAVAKGDLKLGARRTRVHPVPVVEILELDRSGEGAFRTEEVTNSVRPLEQGCLELISVEAQTTVLEAKANIREHGV